MSTELPTQVMPSSDDPSGLPPTKSRRWIWGGVIGALVLVLAVVAAIVLLNQGTSTNTQTKAPTASAVYQQKLSTALTPLVSANRQLSTAMNATDGSKAANNAIAVGLKDAQASLTTTQGAVGTLTVPATDQTTSQETSQALTQENGYLQVVNATNTNPASASAAQVQPSAANLVSALVPLNGIVPGASASIFGVDNFYNWSQGAAAQIKKAQTPKPVAPVIINPTTTVVTPPPSVPSYTAPYSDGYTGEAETQSSGQISFTSGISDGLANSVFYEYWNSSADGSSISVSAWSPASQRYYSADCSEDSTGTINCFVQGTTDPNAEVSFPLSAVDAYTQADADAFTGAGKAGPNG